jgi:hypothetical protein
VRQKMQIHKNCPATRIDMIIQFQKFGGMQIVTKFQTWYKKIKSRTGTIVAAGTGIRSRDLRLVSRVASHSTKAPNAVQNLVQIRSSGGVNISKSRDPTIKEIPKTQHRLKSLCRYDHNFRIFEGNP